MKQRIIIACVFGLLLLPAIVLAGPIIRSGDSVSVEADQTLLGDFYGIGGTVAISGEASQDVYVAGGSVTINAPVRQDLTVLGGTVQAHAVIGDDVRILGGEVTIAEQVAGDVVVMAGALNILSTAKVEGDVLFFGGELTISGTVEGSILARADTMRIDASIGGDVTASIGTTLTLGDRTEILGNVQYESREELARAQGAVVVGDIQKKPLQRGNNPYYVFLLPALSLLFAALTSYLLLRKQIQVLIDATQKSYGIQGLIGLAALLTLPLVAVLLMASVLGMIVGAILMVTYILLLIASWVLSGIVVGVFILKPLTKTVQVSFSSVFLGILVFTLLPLVPFLGPLVMFAVFVIVLGGLATHIYRIFR